MATIQCDGFTVEYDDSSETKDRVFERVMAYFKEHNVFHGESICQMDNPIIDAPSVLADIADEAIGFKVTWSE